VSSETHSEVFIRQSSGLVREVGLWSGALYNISATAPFLAAGEMLPLFIIYANGGNIWLGLAIGTAGGMLLNSVYAHFTAAMPRSGGEYMFLGRTLSPSLGFVVNFANMASYTFWWMTDVVFETGLVYSILAFYYPDSVIGWLNLPWGVFIVGGIFMFIACLVGAAGLRAYIKLQIPINLFAAAIAVVVLAAWIGAFGHFPQLFNAWALTYNATATNAYQSIINTATSTGFSLLPPEGWGMQQTMVVVAIFLIVESPWTAFTTYVAGEIKKAEIGLRQQFMVLLSPLLQGIVFIVFGWIWIQMAGMKFLGALAYSGAPAYLPINTLFWTDGFVASILPSWVALLFVLSVLLAWLGSDMIKVHAISRCIFAWSFDRVIPTKFAHVSDKYKTPTYAIFGLLIINLIVLLAWAIWGTLIFTYIAAATFWGLANLMIVAFAGIIFPYVRKDMFELMPLKGRIAGIPILSIISAGALGVCIWSTLAYLLVPSFWLYYGVGPAALGITVLIYALGLVAIPISRWYWNRKGIDLNIAFRQIPPA
jgi:amino acid transporter